MALVFRQHEKVTWGDLQEIASSLRRLYRESDRLMHLLNGRVLVRWLDPFCGGVKALKFFNELRSALDDEEAKRFDSIKLFYGWGNYPQCGECHSRATWLTWNEPVVGQPCRDLSVHCQQHQVASGANRTRTLDDVKKMHVGEFVDLCSSYRWSREDAVKIVRLWTEGDWR